MKIRFDLIARNYYNQKFPVLRMNENAISDIEIPDDEPIKVLNDLFSVPFDLRWSPESGCLVVITHKE